MFFCSFSETFQNVDGVVISGYSSSYEEKRLTSLLKHRNPKTLFYYFTQETPIRDSDHTELEMFEDLINFTISYRHDSDIYLPYAYIREIKSKSEYHFAKD